MNSWRELFQSLGAALVKFHKGLLLERQQLRWYQWRLRLELSGAVAATEAVLLLVESVYVQKVKEDMTESHRPGTQLN